MKNERYFLLACLHVARIYISSFESSKEELYRRSIIAMGSCKNHRDLQVLKELES